jgi:hypothetical protein
MKLKLSGFFFAAVLALAGTAQARDVFWSVGADVAPGVSVGVGNVRPAAPVIVQPAPVYVAPQPVYVAPRPVYVTPQPVYVAPRPVVVRPAPVYYVEPEHPGRHRGWHKKHKHKHHHNDHD